MNNLKSQEIKQKFSKIQTKNEFCEILNEIKNSNFKNAFPFSLRQLNYYSNPKVAKERYRHFIIPKKNGELRLICAPTKNLKLIQDCINILLQSIFDPHKSATGFRIGKSIKDNAHIHTGNNYVFNIDLKDFFSSIEQPRVWACLKNPPFNLNNERIEIANLIAGICCEKLEVERKNENGVLIKNIISVLPQGAPTSPILTNIVSQRLDFLLTGLAKRFKIRYSRYADDITFSSMYHVYQKDSDFIKELYKIIEEQGFLVKESKTRLLVKDKNRQLVTGLVVNEKVNVTKKYTKQLRQWLYLWERYGYEKARGIIVPLNNKKAKNIENILQGKLDFLKMIVSSDNASYKKLQNRLDKLTQKQNTSIPKIEEQKQEVILEKTVTTNINTKQEKFKEHRPKDTLAFLTLFQNSEGIKFLTHEFDDPDEDFSREKIVEKAKEEFEFFGQKDMIIPESLYAQFQQFAFAENPNWYWTNFEGKKTHFKLGWSCKEVKEWCDNPINEGVYISKHERFLNEMITPFKQSIEIRAGDLNKIIDFLEKNKLKDFIIERKDLNSAKFYTDTDMFVSGLGSLLNPFQEAKEISNSNQIEISFMSNTIDNHRMCIIKIIHLNSTIEQNINDFKLKGDLLGAKKKFNSLCNWSIEASFKDGNKRYNVLDDNKLPEIEELYTKPLGFTHILSFYA